jgi:hypothetical protein
MRKILFTHLLYNLNRKRCHVPAGNHLCLPMLAWDLGSWETDQSLLLLGSLVLSILAVVAQLNWLRGARLKRTAEPPEATDQQVVSVSVSVSDKTKYCSQKTTVRSTVVSVSGSGQRLIHYFY